MLCCNLTVTAVAAVQRDGALSLVVAFLWHAVLEERALAASLRFVHRASRVSERVVDSSHRERARERERKRERAQSPLIPVLYAISNILVGI